MDKVVSVRMSTATYSDEYGELMALVKYYKDNRIGYKRSHTPSGILKRIAHDKFVELKLKLPKQK